MTVHRKYERRTWRPQWYFTLDTCCVNSYLLWKGDIPNLGCRKHRRFREELSSILLNWPYEREPIKRRKRLPLPVPNWKDNEHVWKRFETRSYCHWCKEHAEEWTPKYDRKVLGEIVNEEAPRRRARQSQIWGGFHGCGVPLCQKGACFEAFHGRSNTK
jgi:hypothetical protein